MEQSESNVIEHLLEVESLASSLTGEARNKAAEIVNEAKAKAEQDFLTLFNQQASELEKSFTENSAKPPILQEWILKGIMRSGKEKFTSG